MVMVRVIVSEGKLSKIDRRTCVCKESSWKLMEGSADVQEVDGKD